MPPHFTTVPTHSSGTSFHHTRSTTQLPQCTAPFRAGGDCRSVTPTNQSTKVVVVHASDLQNNVTSKPSASPKKELQISGPGTPTKQCQPIRLRFNYTIKTNHGL